MRKLWVYPLIALVMLLTLGAPAYALEMREGAAVKVAADEVIDDDVLMAGNVVTIDGVINGDVLATGGRVVINGTVNGNLLAFGSSVEVAGRVTGTTFASGQNLLVSGRIERSLVGAGGLVALDETAVIGHSMLTAGDHIELAGQVGRGIALGGSRVTIDGEVGREAYIAADRLRVGESAVIAGQVDYWSDDAEIRGQVGGARWRGSPNMETDGWRPWYLSPWRLLIKLGGFLAAGLVALALLPNLRQRFPERLVQKPWQAPLAGFLILFGLPVAAIILMATVIGLPAGALGLLAFPAISYLGQILLAYAVGHLLAEWSGGLRGQHWALLFVIGALVTTVLTALPIVGTVMTLAALFYGLGGLWFTLVQREEAA